MKRGSISDTAHINNESRDSSRDGGKWWSKDHHLMVIKILKIVDFSLKNVKKW